MSECVDCWRNKSQGFISLIDKGTVMGVVASSSSCGFRCKVKPNEPKKKDMDFHDVVSFLFVRLSV